MAQKTLPKHYVIHQRISMKKNMKLAVLLNIAAVVLLIPFVLGFVYMPIRGEGMSFSADLLPLLLGFLIGTILILILHELVHGLFFKRYSKDKVKYGFNGLFASAGSPGWYYGKREYLIIGMAPCVLIDLALVLLLLFVGGAAFYVVYGILAIHFSGCAGDLYMTMKVMRLPDDVLIQDTGMEMEFWVDKKRAEAATG